MDERKRNINTLKAGKKFRTIALLLGLFIFGGFLVGLSFFLEKDSFWSVMLRDMGFVFCPVAVLAGLYSFFAERNLIAHIEKKISDTINEKLDCISCQKESLTIYPSREKIDFTVFFGRATKKICILLTNLSSLQMHLPLLVERAKNGVDVSVLALNPEHPFVAHRYKELGLQMGKHFFTEMIASLRNFCNKKESEFQMTDNRNFQVKIYDNFPSLMMFCSDESIIVGFILRKGRSKEQVHIEFNTSSAFSSNEHCKDFFKHFELMWKEAKEISCEEIDNIKYKESRKK